MRAVRLALLVAVAALPCAAQTSPSFKLTEAAFNNGGDPNQGVEPTSPHFHVGLDAIGDGVAAIGLASASFRSDAGFVVNYPPPGEVGGLQFPSKTSLNWGDERSVGVYELYRDTLANLATTFGTCYQAALASPSWTEIASPPSGTGWFYIATARNRLGEEGTKGYRTGGVERTNAAPCP